MSNFSKSPNFKSKVLIFFIFLSRRFLAFFSEIYFLKFKLNHITEVFNLKSEFKLLPKR